MTEHATALVSTPQGESNIDFLRAGIGPPVSTYLPHSEAGTYGPAYLPSKVPTLPPVIGSIRIAPYLTYPYLPTAPEVPTGALPHTPVSPPTSDAASTPPFPPVVTAAAIILPTISRFSIGSFYFAVLAGFTPLLHRVQSRANLLPSPRGSPELPQNAVINAMSPDLNSLPPSSPPSLPIRSRMSSSNGDSPMPHSVPASAGAPARGESPTGSPRRLSTSLQAAATMNAGLQHEPSRRSSSGSLSRNRQSPGAGRRRSTVLMNLQLNDPSVPGPGEMVADSQHTQHNSGVNTASPQPMASSPLMVAGGDPHHNRAPSLGELHQELEAEQEAQVNRLLHMIRQQQLQLQQLQAAQGQGSSAIEDSAITSERSNQGTPISQPAAAIPPSGVAPLPSSGSFSRSPGVPHHPRSSFDMARVDIQRRSRTPSRGASPRLRSTSMSGDSGDHFLLGGRDESAFYQAETQMLVRENQMLRHRIRDLEKQLTDLVPGITAHGNPSEPAHSSHLTRATSAGEEDQTTARTTPSIVAVPSAVEATKETS